VVATAGYIGPGKTMNELYNKLGAKAERQANRLAHILRLGPTAVAERIEKHFGDGDAREDAISALRDETPPRLKEACTRMMGYASP
jgi:hypothetical protein